MVFGLNKLIALFFLLCAGICFVVGLLLSIFTGPAAFVLFVLAIVFLYGASYFWSRK